MDAAVESFRDWLVGRFRPDASFESVAAEDGAEAGGADLRVRLHVPNRSYYEVRVLLPNEERGAGEVQVGFGTEHRNVNEEIEELILDNKGDLDDLLADELSELGVEPLHMDHFWERPTFRYAVRLPLAGAEALAEELLRKQVLAVIQASRILFQEAVDEA